MPEKEKPFEPTKLVSKALPVRVKLAVVLIALLIKAEKESVKFSSMFFAEIGAIVGVFAKSTFQSSVPLVPSLAKKTKSEATTLNSNGVELAAPALISVILVVVPFDHLYNSLPLAAVVAEKYKSPYALVMYCGLELVAAPSTFAARVNTSEIGLK